MNRTKGFFVLLLVGLLWALTSVFMRVLSVDLSAYQQVAYRNLIALLMVIPVVFLRKSAVRPEKIRVSHLLGFALSYPVVLVLFTLAVLHTRIEEATFALYFSSTLTGIALGFIAFREKITSMVWFGIALAFAGMYAHSHFFDPAVMTNHGFLYALGAGCLMATCNYFRKSLSRPDNRFRLVAYQSVGGIVVGFLFVWIFGDSIFLDISWSIWGILLLYGMLNLAFAYLLLYGFEHFDLHLGQLVLCSELVFAAIIGAGLYQEHPSRLQMCGLMLILISLAVIKWDTYCRTVSAVQQQC